MHTDKRLSEWPQVVCCNRVINIFKLHVNMLNKDCAMHYIEQKSAYTSFIWFRQLYLLCSCLGFHVDVL